jgi:hypothetical protein
MPSFWLSIVIRLLNQGLQDNLMSLTISAGGDNWQASNVIRAYTPSLKAFWKSWRHKMVTQYDVAYATLSGQPKEFRPRLFFITRLNILALFYRRICMSCVSWTHSAELSERDAGGCLWRRQRLFITALDLCCDASRCLWCRCVSCSSPRHWALFVAPAQARQTI